MRQKTIHLTVGLLLVTGVSFIHILGSGRVGAIDNSTGKEQMPQADTLAPKLAISSLLFRDTYKNPDQQAAIPLFAHEGEIFVDSRQLDIERLRIQLKARNVSLRNLNKQLNGYQWVFNQRVAYDPDLMGRPRYVVVELLYPKGHPAIALARHYPAVTSAGFPIAENRISVDGKTEHTQITAVKENEYKKYKKLLQEVKKIKEKISSLKRALSVKEKSRRFLTQQSLSSGLVKQVVQPLRVSVELAI